MQHTTKASVAMALTGDRLDPGDILTPAELAARLKVGRSWIFERTRRRAKLRDSDPLPVIRAGKYLRFYWPEVCQWLGRQRDL